MTPDEFKAQYPFDTRKACRAAIKADKINGFAESGRLGSTERFRIKVIVGKPTKAQKDMPKRITAAEICEEIYDRMYEAEGEVDRGDFVAAAMRKGINISTARTRFTDIRRDRGHADD